MQNWKQLEGADDWNNSGAVMSMPWEEGDRMRHLVSEYYQGHL